MTIIVTTFCQLAKAYITYLLIFDIYQLMLFLKLFKLLLNIIKQRTVIFS